MAREEYIDLLYPFSHVSVSFSFFDAFGAFDSVGGLFARPLVA